MQNLESEKTLLGCILLKPSLLNEDVCFIEPSYFTNIHYRTIFSMILKMHRTNQPIDFVTVSSALRDAKQLEEIGGRAFINDLVIEIPSIATARFHASIVEKNYLLRQIHNTAYDMMEQAKSGGNPNEIIANSMNSIHRISLKEVTDEKINLMETPNSILGSLTTSKEGTELFYTGYPEMDEIVNGVCRGDVIAIGAYTSIGKSVFCGCLALSAYHQLIPVHIFSLEMSRAEYLNRLMSNVCQISLDKFKSKEFTPKEIELIERMEEKLFNTFDLTIYDRPVVDTDYIYNKLLIEKKKRGTLGLVIVDHIHLMRGKGNSPREKYSMIAENLKQIARELECYMVMVCQLRRNSYTDLKTGETVVPKPTLNDFKESGDIENVANVAILLHRQDRTTILTEVNIAKNRDGEVGACFLNFYGQFAKFTSSKIKAL